MGGKEEVPRGIKAKSFNWFNQYINQTKVLITDLKIAYQLIGGAGTEGHNVVQVSQLFQTFPLSTIFDVGNP